MGMDNKNRAKQFMPFSALKGYDEALYEKEKPLSPPAKLAEDALELLDRKLHMLHPSGFVTIVFYNNGEYQKITGSITHLNTHAGYLEIKNTRIHFSDIYDIE